VLDRIQRLGLDLEGVVDLNFAQKQGTNNMGVHGFGLLEELSQLSLTGLDSDSARLHDFLNKFFLALSTQITIKVHISLCIQLIPIQIVDFFSLRFIEILLRYRCLLSHDDVVAFEKILTGDFGFELLLFFVVDFVIFLLFVVLPT
jgi:hypothetical protein